MAAYTSILDSGKCLSARNEELNAVLMDQQPQRRRCMRTPEFAFPKNFDNSRLVKTFDPARARQIRLFVAACTIFLSLLMIDGVQHFSAIEKGYQIESEKLTREKLREDNRQLRLTEAQLTQPDRIDRMARELGLAEPQPGQMVYPAAAVDASAPALAQAVPQRTATSSSY
jgi:cell division protein FtsL